MTLTVTDCGRFVQWCPPRAEYADFCVSNGTSTLNAPSDIVPTWENFPLAVSSTTRTSMFLEPSGTFSTLPFTATVAVGHCARTEMPVARSTKATKNIRHPTSLLDRACAAKAFFLKVVSFIIISPRKVHPFMSDGGRKRAAGRSKGRWAYTDLVMNSYLITKGTGKTAVFLLGFVDECCVLNGVRDLRTIHAVT